MANGGSPLVSVVIPVYNGQDTIADAIRSVLAQTYSNFNLTIANNCSTDGTAAIAEEFARNDPRIRVYHATEFVSVVDSHNRAFTLISDDAAYCKILMADDWLFPNCLAELVAIADMYPTTGMVSSYMLRENRVVFDGLPYTGPFWKGRDVARRYLLEGIDSFGGPSASLIRASVVRVAAAGRGGREHAGGGTRRGAARRGGGPGDAVRPGLSHAGRAGEAPASGGARVLQDAGEESLRIPRQRVLGFPRAPRH